MPIEPFARPRPERRLRVLPDEDASSVLSATTNPLASSPATRAAIPRSCASLQLRVGLARTRNKPEIVGQRRTIPRSLPPLGHLVDRNTHALECFFDRKSGLFDRRKAAPSCGGLSAVGRLNRGVLLIGLYGLSYNASALDRPVEADPR